MSTDQNGSKSIEDRATKVRWLILAFLAFAAASAYLTRYCLAVTTTTIQEELQFSEVQMGWILSAFAAGYLLFQVPGGWLGDRFGARKAFSSMSVMWSLFTVWLATGGTFLVMVLSRFAFGLAQAGLTPISARIVRNWIPLDRRGISSAIIGASMSIGGAFTMYLTGRLMDVFDGDWRLIFHLYSLVGIVWAVAFYVVFREKPEQHKWVNVAELNVIRHSENEEGPVSTASAEVKNQSNEAASEGEGASAIEKIGSTRHLALQMASSKSMWAISFQSFFRTAGFLFFVTWFPAYLEYSFNVSPARAGTLATVPLVATVIGSLLGGWVIDFLLTHTRGKWISRCGTSTVTLGLCAGFTLAASWGLSVEGLVVLMSVGALFAGLSGPASWAATIDLGGTRTALIFGIMNMAGVLAGVVLPPSIGYLMGDIRASGGDWNSIIYLHVAFYVLGALAWLFVDPRPVIDDAVDS